MTQTETKNAVRRINKKLSDLLNISGLGSDLTFRLLDVIHDVENLDRHLSERKPATPNCRPATPEELRQLCTSSNVVVFQPAA